MIGTLSRIPRGRNLVASHLESLGLALAEEDDSAAPSSPGNNAISASTTGTASLRQASAAKSMEPGRRFSVALVTSMQDALRRGDVTLTELSVALGNASLRSEDDIRLVLDQTIRLKQAIIALGPDAQRLMTHVHPGTVAFLLRCWTAEHS